MKSSLKIGSILGIGIELHITFLLLLFIVGLLGLEFFVLVIMVFFFVLVHELSHSIVAQRLGIKIRKITLLPIGGVASMEEQVTSPRDEFLMAIAGPLSNFVIVGITLAILITTNGINGFSSLLLSEYTLTPTGLLVMAFRINLMLGMFNLFVPALPMDGGRVFRAALAMKIGMNRATEKATGLARFLAFLMFSLGLLYYNWLLVIIAIFIYIGATQEFEMMKLNSLLSGEKVKDIMSIGAVGVDPGTSLEELSNLIIEKKHMGYPVMQDNKMIGIVTFTDLAATPKEMWNQRKVGDVMTTSILTASPDDDVMEVFMKMMKGNIGRVPIVIDDTVVGIVSKTDIIRIVQVMRLKEVGL